MVTRIKTSPLGMGRGSGAPPTVPPAVVGATQFQVHIGGVPAELSNLMQSFAQKAATESSAILENMDAKHDRKDKEQKIMVNVTRNFPSGAEPDPRDDDTKIREFNQVGVANFAPGSKKLKLHNFMDDLRQALCKNDDQMHLFWRYQAKTIHDTVMLRDGVQGIEIDFDNHWKAFVPNYAHNIEQAAECIRLHCRGRNSTVAGMSLFDLMTTDKIRLFFIQLIRTFAFDSDVAASKHAPTIDDKLKMTQMRTDVLNWFLQYRV